MFSNQGKVFYLTKQSSAAWCIEWVPTMFQVVCRLFKRVNLFLGSANIELTTHQVKSIFAERYAQLLYKTMYSASFKIVSWHNILWKTQHAEKQTWRSIVCRATLQTFDAKIKKYRRNANFLKNISTIGFIISFFDRCCTTRAKIVVGLENAFSLTCSKTLYLFVNRFGDWLLI